MSTKSPKTVAALYAQHEALKELAKLLYDEADSTLKKLVRLWGKDCKAIIGTLDVADHAKELRNLIRALKKKQPKLDEGHRLEIEDQFRGATKAFAPGYAHRYKLKPRTIDAD